MYSFDDLRQEIGGAYLCLEGKDKEGVSKIRLIRMVMKDHGCSPGKDVDFEMYCINQTVSQAVDRYFRDIKESEGSAMDSQLRLPGYEHLQSRYVIERNEESRIVSIENMMDEEIEVKACEHDTMGQGHLAHAKELRRYARERNKKLV